MTEFQALGLSPTLLKTVQALGFADPTPIQVQAIPLVLAGHDVMGLAQTGTGKTGAFGLPLVQQLLADRSRPAPKTVRALILAPTRELVNQMTVNLKSFANGGPLKIESVTGGKSINMQIRSLRHGVDILAATPGRLIDLLDRRTVRLDETKFLVLDEADQMLDLGFIHALRKIAQLVGSPRQTMLFSATMAKQIEQLAQRYLTDPVRVETARVGRAADKITQSVHFVEKADKAALLKKCLAERPGDLSLVFSRTKYGAEKLMKQLVKAGFDAVSIHGNKSQGQRDRALKAFRSGKARVLVATDVAARGIDIPGVSHVYNFDLPEVAENYVHRIGRTARAGAEGEGVAFCSPEEIGLLRAVEKLMRKKIDVASGEIPADSRASRPSRGGRNNGAGKRARPHRRSRREANGAVQQSDPLKQGGKRQTQKSGDMKSGDGAKPAAGKPRGKPRAKSSGTAANPEGGKAKRSFKPGKAKPANASSGANSRRRRQDRPRRSRNAA
ncbi:MAG: DEAD/DEAH box helicase [Pseudomonadota bacterium]